MIHLLLATALLGVTETGTGAPLAGHVVDATGAPVPGALVVVCDASTGVPVHVDDWQPFTRAFDQRDDKDAMRLVTQVTDASGAFAFEDAAAGRYRLVAQTWADREHPAEALFDENSKVLTLRGVVDGVLVPSPEASALTLRPAGTATLEMDLRIGNDGLLVVVSLGAPPADPILGFAAWSGAFGHQMIAGNRALRGDTTIHGLPAGSVWVQVFANDNNPGFGAATVNLTANQVTPVDVPIVATWSDGHHQPPPRLQPLVDRLAAMPEPGPVMMNACEQIGLDPRAMRGADAWGNMIPYLGKEVSLPDGTRVPFADLAAAFGYLQMKRTMEKRKK